jgi:hypothetical protein
MKILAMYSKVWDSDEIFDKGYNFTQKEFEEQLLSNFSKNPNLILNELTFEVIDDIKPASNKLTFLQN